MKGFFREARGVLTFGMLAVNTVFWFVPLMTLALLKLLLPIAAVRRLLTRWLMWLAENWIAVNGLVLRGSGSREWRAEGIDSLDKDGWYLVLANHQTWVDIVVLQVALNRRIPLLKFFIKQQLIWFPLLGLGFWALDMPFMKRHPPSYLARHPEKKGADLEATRKACKKFRHTPTSVINFVEGTRFSEAKREARNSPYEHLLLPRAGGIAIALSAMGDVFDAILDVTLVYAGGPPKFWDMVCGDRVDVTVDVRVLPVDRALASGDYQNDREFRREVHRWLGRLWKDKDARIAEIKDRVA
ncbi:MAG TPA: acyltransferase [Woeseiaceae bacterium]|nr:acyltransferase [Woeseiaceae bacterium]